MHHTQLRRTSANLFSLLCRQCNRMRSVLAALALHALRSRMKETLTELVGTVSLRNKLAQGRQRRAFNAWLQLASAMHWRRNRMQTLCWLAWQAQAVAARRSLWKAKQRHHSWRLRLGMRAWKVAYTQVATLPSPTFAMRREGSLSRTLAPHNPWVCRYLINASS